MANEKNFSFEMFNELHRKFGANFFLTILILALSTLWNLNKDLSNCQKEKTQSEEKHSDKVSKIQEAEIQYLREEKHRVDSLFNESKKIEKNTERAEKQVHKLQVR
jgi:hypothetical protein